MVYLITGKKGAGKTTYAERLVAELEKDHKVKWYDGDRFREETGNSDYSDKGRYGNLMSAAWLAQKDEQKGIVVVMSFIAPKKLWRQNMRCHFKHSHVIYIPGGKLWEGTEYEVPDIEELTGVIRGRTMTVNGLWMEVADE